jgi:hypothetical protein
MDTYDVAIPESINTSRVTDAVERICTSFELEISLCDTLATYPGCTHWHLRKPKHSGTLEVTWWPSENRLWLSVQSGRRAEWIEDVVPSLRTSLQHALR